MRRGCVIGALLLAVVGCQPAAPPPASEPAAAVAAAAPAAPAPSTAVWAEVPRQICTCHEEALGRVETTLQDSQLAVEFKIEGGNEGWHVFSVTFDPTRVSVDRVKQVLKDAGALIIPAPVDH
jgi:hypothetical protein